MSGLFEKEFMAFNLIYWTPICNEYFQGGSVLEKCEKSMEKIANFPGDFSWALLYLKEHVVALDFIYWTPVCKEYF